MLRCDQLTLRLGSFTLGPVCAEARCGAMTALVGPNASGKTTLLRALCGVLRGRGTVHVNDRVMAECPPQVRAGMLAFVPQRVQGDVPLTVEALVRLGRLRRPSVPERIEVAMASLGLEALRTRPVGQLSVGQRQRVHIARALAQIEPDGILVLDEPTAPLDPDWAHRVWGVLRGVTTAGGTVLASVHDLAAARAVADDAWLLRDGQLVGTGSAATMLEPAGLESLFGTAFIALGNNALPMPAWMDGADVS
jgi:iron complex transport system ATP-binding protein